MEIPVVVDAQPDRPAQELADAREALRRSDERLQRILESITDALIVVDADWRITYINRRGEEILAPLAVPARDLVGRDLWSAFPPLLGTQFETAYRRALAEGTSVELEEFYPPLRSWFAVRAFPSVEGLSILFQDVTPRKQAQLRLAAERRILEMITTGSALQDILERIALEAEQQSADGMLCSVLLLDEAGTRLLHGAAPSLPGAYNAAIHGITIGPCVGSCGTAAHERRAVWVEDIQSDPLWAGFRDLAREHGLAACCSTPLLAADGSVLGTIAMYYRKPWRPREGDAHIIELAARLASIAIDRRRSELALRRQSERLRVTFDQAGVGIYSSDEDGNVVEANPKFCQIVGYSQQELLAMRVHDLTHPDDRARTEQAVAALLAGETGDYVLEKRYLSKSGPAIWCRVTTTLSRADAGGVRFIRLVEDITERKLAEEALSRSEQFNRSVIASSRDCFKTLTLQGHLTWISDRGIQALCIDDVDAVIGRCWIDFWEGEQRELARAAVESAAAGGSGSFVGRYPVRGVDRWWDVAVTPIRDAGGRPESLLAVSRDITERFEAASRVKESAEQLEQLANLIPQLAWMAAPDGRIFWYNEGWYRYTGCTREQMEGWGWESVHDPELLPKVKERWIASLTSGEPFEMEFPLRGADGEFRWFLTRVNPMRDSQGRVTRWFGTNTNVDNVRRIRQALEEETRMLELLNRTGLALASTLDLHSLLQTITDAGTELSGARFGAFFYNQRDERGEAFTLYTLSGAALEQFSRFGQPRATPLFGPIFRGEHVIRCDDVTLDPRYGKWEPHRGLPKGHPPVRSYLAVPVVTGSGEVLGGLFFGHPEPGIFTERSERLVSAVAAQAAVAVDNARLYQAARSAAEERELLLESERHARSAAEHAARMKDEFLATLSHELRTPLSAILGWTQVLKLKSGSVEDVRRGVDAIDRNARVQKQLIEDLLDMSRIASGKLRLNLEPIELRAVVEAAIETVRPSAEAKKVRLDVALDAATPPVRGDAARLQQVVWNLLVNAIKFTPAGGSVRVELNEAEGGVQVRVSDTGQGIEPEFLQHIFERFRQADSSITRHHGGLGLGLAIVRQLVELHGGSVQAHSEGRGRGASFSVVLPPAAATRGIEVDGQLPAVPGDFRTADLRGLKILVVDDQEDARELIARVLTECHAHPLLASNAAQALEIVRRERPHALVSDIGMPEVDGFQLLARVRALGPEQGGDVPAIALTAFARPEDRDRALRAGFRLHQAKPLEPAELVANIAAVVRAHPATGDVAQQA